MWRTSGGSGGTFFSENQSQRRILETSKKKCQGQELLLVSLIHPLKEIGFSCQIVLTKQIFPKMTIFFDIFQKKIFFFFFSTIPSCYMVLRSCVIYFMVKLNIPGCAGNPRPEKWGHMTLTYWPFKATKFDWNVRIWRLVNDILGQSNLLWSSWQLLFLVPPLQPHYPNRNHGAGGAQGAWTGTRGCRFEPACP